MPVGEIRLFAGNFAPAGWAFCEGQTLNAADYPELAFRIKNTYGGDGRTTIALPDLRGRAPMHRGDSMRLGDTKKVSIEDGPFPSSIALNYLISTQKPPFGNDAYVGEIRIFAGNRASRGWILCDGRSLPIAGHTAFFAVIGKTYAASQDPRRFSLPDLLRRTPVHPATSGDLGKVTNARDYDEGATAKTHLAVRYYIASEGIFPQR